MSGTFHHRSSSTRRRPPAITRSLVNSGGGVASGGGEPGRADALAQVGCRNAEASLERTRERAAILESARTRNLGDRERAFVDQPMRTAEALLDEYRMRRFAVHGRECPDEMARRIARHAREPGD